MFEDRLGMQLLSRAMGTSEIWLAVSYLTGMFAVLAFRPQSIASPFTFRLSFIFFVLYLVAPTAVECAFLALNFDFFNLRRSHLVEGTLFIHSATMLMARVMFGLSIYCALSSLMGKRREERRISDE